MLNARIDTKYKIKPALGSIFNDLVIDIACDSPINFFFNV